MKKIFSILVFLFCLSLVNVGATVQPVHAAEIADNPQLVKKVKVCVGRKLKLKVTGTTQKVTWSSSDKEIVKVNKKVGQRCSRLFSFLEICFQQSFCRLTENISSCRCGRFFLRR